VRSVGRGGVGRVCERWWFEEECVGRVRWMSGGQRDRDSTKV